MTLDAARALVLDAEVRYRTAKAALKIADQNAWDANHELGLARDQLRAIEHQATEAQRVPAERASWR